VALDLRAHPGAGYRQRDRHCHLHVAALCGTELLDNGQNAAAVRQEFLTLSQNPQANPARFHSIVDTWWGLSYSTPSIASADWVTVALLVLVMIPFIVVMGLKHARPLALQFSRLRDAAKDVADGQFGRQAELIKDAPAEMVSFATDFNSMTGQLARYEKELRASHVAMAHELRSPLTAAIGRLQGMLDGVFDASPAQLGMVMKQLQHLNRLTDELHLLSLGRRG
jgi:signal transduction histidine kinase